VVVSLAGRLGVGPFNSVRARWNDDLCAWAVTQDSIIGWIAIISSIGSELADLIADLIQQRLQLRGIAGFLICQTMCNDLATVGINHQVQFSPVSSGLCPIFFFQPLASAIDLQPGAVYQNVNRSVSHMLSVVASGRWLPGSGPPAQRGVIGHRQIQSHQPKHRTQKPFTLAQPQSEYHAQHHRSFDRQIRVTRLASSRLASWNSPTAKCFRRYPKGHTATAAKARLVLLPVRHFEFDLGDTVSTGGVVLMRHAGPIKLFPILAA